MAKDPEKNSAADQPREDTPAQPVPGQPVPGDVPGQQPEDSSSKYTIILDQSAVRNSDAVIVPNDQGGLEIRISFAGTMHSQDIRTQEIDPQTGKPKEVIVKLSAVNNEQ